MYVYFKEKVCECPLVTPLRFPWLSYLAAGFHLEAVGFSRSSRSLRGRSVRCCWGVLPGWLGQALPLGIPIPLGIPAQKPENTGFIPVVLLSRQAVRTCPVLQGKGLFSLSMEETRVAEEGAG